MILKIVYLYSYVGSLLLAAHESFVLAFTLSSCGHKVPELTGSLAEHVGLVISLQIPSACGILVTGLGTEPMALALQGRFSTAGLPVKSLPLTLYEGHFSGKARHMALIILSEVKSNSADHTHQGLGRVSTCVFSWDSQMSGLFYKRRLSDIRLNLANITGVKIMGMRMKICIVIHRRYLKMKFLPIIYSFLTFATSKSEWESG